LRGVPGISLGAGETSWQGNNLILRGFTTRNDTFLDGMRDYGYYFRDPFNSEAVEVIKGPGSMLFGRGSTGGVINQASKAPTLESIAKAEIALGTDNTRRATADIGTPIGETSAVRLAAMRHISEVAARDGARSSRWGLAPTIAFGIGTPLRLQLSYLHQEEDNRPDYGIPWFNGRPAKVDRRNYYGFSDDYQDTKVNIVTAKLEYDLSPNISVRERLRYSHNSRRFRTSEAVIPPGTAATTPLSAITVTRNEFSGTSKDQFFQSQTDVTARFESGGMRHTLVAGVELGQEMPRPTYIFHEGVIPTNLADPLPQAFAQARSYVRLRARTSAKSVGFFGIDTIEIGERWLAIAGLRWDRVDAHYSSIGYTNTGAVAATTKIDRVDSKASYRGALVYKPSAGSSLYASFATSFNPSAEGIESLISAGRSVAQANINAEPETGRILELGGKISLLSNRLLLTVSGFSVRKSNVRIPSSTVANQNINGGVQRVRGAEIEATGALTDRWTVRASYTHLDSETLAVSNPAAGGGPRIGAPLTITPKDSASLQTDYVVADGLRLGGGVIYQSARLGQNTVASYLRAPGYAIFEARGRYDFNDGLSAQLNFYNIGNRLYYDQLHPFHVVPGAGRSALISVIWKR
jgi:catecholate siderophore receptor